MSKTKELKRYVKRVLAKGHDEDKIKKILLEAGWSIELTNEVFNEMENKPKGFFARRKESREAIRKSKEIEGKEELKETEEKKEQEDTKPEKKIGLSEKVNDLTEKMNILVDGTMNKKHKPFKLPFAVKSQLKSLAQKDKVLVILLKTNRDASPMVAKIKNGFIEINEKFYDCNTSFIYLWMHKYPCIVLPEWSLKPIGTKDYFDAIKSGDKADAQQIIIRRLENAESLSKPKVSPKIAILIFLGVAALCYVLFSKG